MNIDPASIVITIVILGIGIIANEMHIVWVAQRLRRTDQRLDEAIANATASAAVMTVIAQRVEGATRETAADTQTTNPCLPHHRNV